MTKIEEVAYAICAAQFGDCPCRDKKAPACPPEAKNARAAIAAMREPSKAMVDSGVAFALNVSVSGEGGWTKYITEKHRAMIDAALNEGDAP